MILALDLYLRSGLLGNADQEAADFSRVINNLTIHSDRPDPLRFRNSNGVAMKLANFAAIDPNYVGRGMTRGGKRDTEVWDRYASDEDTLAATAQRLERGANHHGYQCNLTSLFVLTSRSKLST